MDDNVIANSEKYGYLSRQKLIVVLQHYLRGRTGQWDLFSFANEREVELDYWTDEDLIQGILSELIGFGAMETELKREDVERYIEILSHPSSDKAKAFVNEHRDDMDRAYEKLPPHTSLVKIGRQAFLGDFYAIQKEDMEVNDNE